MTVEKLRDSRTGASDTRLGLGDRRERVPGNATGTQGVHSEFQGE